MEEIPLSRGGQVLVEALKSRDPVYGIRRSFNNWVEKILPVQISAGTHIVGEYVVKFGPSTVLPPYRTTQGVTIPDTPVVAKLNKRSYMSEIRSHVSIYYRDEYEECERNGADCQPAFATTVPINIGQIPCMVHSKFCNLAEKGKSKLTAMGEDERDPGGYFIIDGVERLTFLAEMLAVNRYRLGQDKDANKYCSIIAETERGTMITTLTVVRVGGKNELGTSFVHLRLNDTMNRIADKTRTKKNTKSLNIFKAIQVYIYMVQHRLGDQAGDFWGYVSRPYNLLQMVLEFVKPERRSKVETFLSDSIYDAAIRPDGDTYLRRTVLTGLTDEQLRGNRAEETLVHTLDSAILSHLDPADPIRKVHTICMMVAMLSEHAVGFRKETDRDAWVNKRLATSAKKCEQLFRGTFKSFVRKVLEPFLPQVGVKRRQAQELTLEALKREITNNRNFIPENLKSSFKSQWGLFTVNVKSDNPVQALQRTTFMEFLSMLNRVDVTVLSRRAKSLKIRSIQPDQWGFIGPGETVESNSVGIVKTKAVTSQMTVSGDASEIIRVLEGLDGPIIDGQPHRKGLYAFTDKIEKKAGTENLTDILLINGRFYGWCNGYETRRVMVAARRQGKIDREASIVYDDKDGYVYIHADEGRLVRPVLIIDDDGVPVIEKKDMWGSTFDELLRDECVEYIDAYEQSFLRVASVEASLEQYSRDVDATDRVIREATQAEDEQQLARASDEMKFLRRNKYTHLELHPQATYGVALSIMPFLNFNQAPRVTYQSKMGAQALGIPHLNHSNRFDNETKIMLRPTRPMVANQLEKVLNLDVAPQGLTLQVAFLNIKGDTQEDAFYIKKEVVEAGYLNTSHYITIEVVIDATKHRLGRPRPHHGEDQARYRFLTGDGLPMINAPLNQGDYIVGRSRADGKNISVPLKIGEYGIVDSVYVSQQGQKKYIKIKLRHDRQHQVGDKLTSRYAQKGTTSRIYPSSRLPFDEITGESADMYVNTHSVPKRMTMGYIKEPLFGILSALTGERYNGSAFETHDMDEVYRQLERRGFKNKGYRWMVNPETGMRYKAMVFMGPIYIQMLHHFGPEKLQVRSRGVVKLLTRQPPQGTAYGGRRIGEMERNTMITHGATNFVIERLVKMSDAYTPAFCKNCGEIAVVKPDSRIIECSMCDNTTEFVRTTIPYVYKLLVQLMFGAGIYIHLDFGKESAKQEDIALENIFVSDEEGEGDDNEVDDSFDDEGEVADLLEAEGIDDMGVDLEELDIEM